MSIILKTKTTKVEYGIPEEDWGVSRLYGYIRVLKIEVRKLSDYMSTFKCSTEDRVKISKSIFSLYMTIDYTEKRIAELGVDI